MLLPGHKKSLTSSGKSTKDSQVKKQISDFSMFALHYFFIFKIIFSYLIYMEKLYIKKKQNKKLFVVDNIKFKIMK